MAESFLNKVRAAKAPAPEQARPAPAVLSVVPGELNPYAVEALNRETLNVSTAVEGTRNDALNVAAFNLGQLVAGGELPPRLVWDALMGAARSNGLDETEATATMRSGLRKGEESPRQAPAENPAITDWLNSLPDAPKRQATQPGDTGPGQSPTDGTPTPENAAQPPAGTPDLAAGMPLDVLHREAALELLKLKSRELAQRAFKQEQKTQTPPPVQSLTQFLTVEDDEARYRVHGLLPAGGRIVLAAQYKAGKSSMVGNLVKAMADGEAFLDSFNVEKATRIVVIDDELDERQMRRWYREQAIQNTDAVRIVALRGRLSTFDIIDPVTRAEWAAKIAGADVVILDCLRPILDALGLDENRDAGKFLVAFDALLAEIAALGTDEAAGPPDAVVVHHMGHGGARSRGDSRILDWPDATWTVTRENVEDPNSPRYFSALGRDVRVGESLLEWTEATRHLSIVGGGRADRGAGATRALMEKIVAFVTQNPNVTGRGLELALGGNNTARRAALQLAVDEGYLMRLSGENRGYKYIPKPGGPTLSGGF